MTFFKQNKGVGRRKTAQSRSKTSNAEKRGWRFVHSLLPAFHSAAFLSPLTPIMPKEPKCTGKRCSLTKAEKSQDHYRRYHDPEPVTLTSCWTGQKLKLKRTGKDLNFHCVHPDCTKHTPIRNNCITHHQSCKYFSDQYKRKLEGTVSSTSSAVSPRITVKEGSSVPIFAQPEQEAGKKTALKFFRFQI
jgi:hypothetical protein